MDFSEGSSSEILGRLSTAYGVETQKQLAEKLGVSAANVSNWVQRNSVPGSAFVRCALDTGCDLSWLATGKIANANISNLPSAKLSRREYGKVLLQQIISNGGRPIIKRVMDAYGFTTQKELSEYLDISTGTISTWVRRNYFPGEVVITCALDTGRSLDWLATGNTSLAGVNNKNERLSQHLTLKKKKLSGGKIEDDGECIIDRIFLSESFSEENTYLLMSGVSNWLVSTSFNDLCNGMWLLDIDGALDVYTVSKRPLNKVFLSRKNSEFECYVSEIGVKGVVTTLFDKIL